LHFGSLVAALGSYLEARSHEGHWHLRIDDLDPPRIAPGATDSILRDLEALGFEWTGPVVFQSRHGAAYHAALHALRNADAAYPCSCSRKDIEQRATVGSEGPVYPGWCRDGMPTDRRARVWRMRVESGTVEFEDRLFGAQRIDLARDAGDFTLYRADGVYSFHLASAVDEGELGITDVVRGSDLLESSMRQIYLLDRLQRPIPSYVHLPIATDANGAKLSKQTGAPPISTEQPAATLTAVWRFLQQRTPHDFAHAALDDWWAYAISNWDLESVGARRSAPA
jgi:glutamyl-Q tRNA(Asp) synthetase